MLAPLTPQRAGPSIINAHLPLFRRRVNSSDEDEAKRPEWPICRQHFEFDDGDYEHTDDIEPWPVRRQKSARSRAYPFMDAETRVNKDASNDKTNRQQNC